MQYNVSQLLKEATGASRRYPVQARYSEPGRFAESVSGEVVLIRTHQGVLVQAQVEAQVRHTCGRCLIEFTWDCDIMVEEEYFPQTDVYTGQRIAIPEDADGLPIDTDHVLDLTEAVRQCIISAQPMKPLCRRDCRGLCQECGVNLNRGKCNCLDEPRDPRWGALTALLRDSKG
jgi:uncharacterized protein